MSIIDTLIFDRTFADQQRTVYLIQRILKNGFGSLEVLEQVEYLAGLRGCYNYVDMNRVGAVVSYLAGRMIDASWEIAVYREAQGVAYSSYFDMPYDVNEVQVNPKTNWTDLDEPTKAQETQYLADLLTLRMLIPLPPDAPLVPATLDALSLDGANDIERLLFVIDSTLTLTIAEVKSRIDRAVLAYAYSGMEYSAL